VRVHVGEAVLDALAVVAEGKAQAAIAFPDGRRHLHGQFVAPVSPALQRLGITVFWVREDGTVSVEHPRTKVLSGRGPPGFVAVRAAVQPISAYLSELGLRVIAVREGWHDLRSPHGGP
jgi:hypothetical protein